MNIFGLMYCSFMESTEIANEEKWPEGSKIYIVYICTVCFNVIKNKNLSIITHILGTPETTGDDMYL